MLKYCESIADWLLEAIVPRVDAGACCPDTGWHCSWDKCDEIGEDVWYFKDFYDCNCRRTRRICSFSCW
jgi:hypothetical protein